MTTIKSDAEREILHFLIASEITGRRVHCSSELYGYALDTGRKYRLPGVCNSRTAKAMASRGLVEYHASLRADRRSSDYVTLTAIGYRAFREDQDANGVYLPQYEQVPAEPTIQSVRVITETGVPLVFEQVADRVENEEALMVYRTADYRQRIRIPYSVLMERTREATLQERYDCASDTTRAVLRRAHPDADFDAAAAN